ncbi:hypothetical protein [Pimelobacter simplex]|uniref:hypothetical protein n=1 Tax=Nocardioides simplex TaxID=2045 RepID=UPI003AB048C2
MKHLSVRRSAAGLFVASTALAGLAAVPSPAHAAPNLTGGTGIDLSFTYEGGGGCTTPTAADSPGLPITDDGRTVTQTWSDAKTSVASGNPADITDLRASGTTTISATPIGPSGATIKGTARVTASVLPRLATTVCKGRAEARFQAGGGFTVGQPMWVTVTAQGSGRGMMQVVGVVEGEPAVTVLANSGNGSTTALLPAGEANFQIETLTAAQTTGVRSTAYSGSFSIRLAPLGQASPVSGKGRSHVSLGARSCASNTIAGALTKKAKTAKKVVVKVNGAKAASFQGKKLKKRAFSVRAASSAKAQVTATITLRNGKTVSVSRSYLPCS